MMEHTTETAIFLHRKVLGGGGNLMFGDIERNVNGSLMEQERDLGGLEKAVVSETSTMAL